MKGKKKMPAKDSLRGKVLGRLTEAGGRGVTGPDLAVALGDPTGKNLQLVQSAVYGLRQMGIRVDFDSQSYVLKGRGASYTRYSKGGDWVPVSRTKRQKKGSTKRVSLVQQGAKQAVQSPRPEAKQVGAGIFIVRKGEFKRALDLLPNKQREGLLKLGRVVEAYNTVCGRIMRMNDEMRRELEALTEE